MSDHLVGSGKTLIDYERYQMLRLAESGLRAMLRKPREDKCSTCGQMSREGMLMILAGDWAWLCPPCYRERISQQ